jgi:cell division transport system permease protein
MNIKNHITLILALISILLSIFLFNLFSKILYAYQQTIINNYSIIIVSNKAVEKIDLNEIEKIEPINIQSYIKALKNKFRNIDFNKIKFPYFYSIKLKTLPTPEKLDKIENYLKSLPFIKRVLTYRSSQTKIYNLLFLVKLISNTFMIITAILGFFLIIKQLEVWKYEHSERMYIMELFGAPFWFKGAAIFKISFIDSFISFILTLSLIYIFINSSLFAEIIKSLSINFSINLGDILIKLFIISIIISVISSLIVIFESRK